MSEQEQVEVTDEVSEEDQAAKLAQANIQEMFDSCRINEDDEDDTKLALIGLDTVTFKNVTRIYNQLMVSGGYMLSKEEKSEHVVTTLEGLEFDTEEGYDAAVSSLVTDMINERSAGALLRAHAKKNELEIFKKPKTEGSGEPRFAQTFYNLLVENPTISEEEAKAFIMNPENSPNTHRMLNFFQKVRETVNAVAAKFIEPTAEEAA